MEFNHNTSIKRMHLGYPKKTDHKMDLEPNIVGLPNVTLYML